MATMSPSRTISEINGDFSRRSQIFPTPVYFAPPLKYSLGIWYQCSGSKNHNDGATGSRKTFWRYLQPCRYST